MSRSDRPGGQSVVARLASLSLFGLELPLLGLWFVLATLLGLITDRVADWNDMTDELVWERLSISVGQGHSLLPRLHGEVIRSLSQLYPVLVAPFFWVGHVPGDVKNAHVFNAWLMTSAAIPAFLLAKRVTNQRWAAYLLALLAVCTPWIMYTTAIVTEVAAFPAFLWAVFAMHRTLTDPAKRNDVLVLVTLVLAFLARTQFTLLLGVLPVALLLFELTAPRSVPLTQRLTGGVVETIRKHLVLTAVYAVLAVGYLVTKAVGYSLTHLTVYGQEHSPTVLSSATAGSFTGHAADLAFGVGLLPFLVGAAWLIANLVRPSAKPELRAFVCVAGATIAVLMTIVSAWDLTIGQFVLDRYLFYLVPLLLLAFICALRDEKRPRFSLVLPAAVISYGFARHLQQEFLWSGQFPLSFDSPIAPPYKWFARLGGGTGGASAILIALSVGLCGLFVAASRWVRPARLTATLSVVLLVAFPIDTAYMFHNLFSRPGHSGRPLTQSVSGVLDWLDQTIGPNARVTEVPYPVSSSFLVTQGFWRDLEFWNKSVRYDVHYPSPDVYDDAVSWFPNTALTFNPQTGLASASWSPYVVQSVTETRFRISGNEQVARPDVMLIDASMPWRTDWLTSGLYDDGWTLPKTTARIRVFAVPGQKGAVMRSLSIQVQAPDAAPEAPFTLHSDLETIRGKATNTDTTFEQLHICVPAHGFSEATFTTTSDTEIPGDQKSLYDSNLSRQGGLHLADIALSDDVGPSCKVG